MQTVRVYTVMRCQQRGQVPAEVRVKARREQMDAGLQQGAQREQVLADRQQHRRIDGAVEQEQRLNVFPLFENIPYRILPEKVVEIAQFIQVNERILTQVALDFTCIMQAHHRHNSLPFHFRYEVNSTTPRM